MARLAPRVRCHIHPSPLKRTRDEWKMRKKLSRNTYTLQKRRLPFFHLALRNVTFGSVLEKPLFPKLHDAKEKLTDDDEDN